VAEGSNPAGIFVGALVGLAIGAVVTKFGVHLNPRCIPNEITYLRATPANPFPISSLHAKSAFETGWDVGGLVGELVKLVPASG